jgi:glycosyltransferase involved in cell wall biosynthesis
VSGPPIPAGRVAIVHEKFTVHAGSERVVEQLHALWPDAPIFTSVCDPAVLSPALAHADIRPVATLQRLYRGGDHYAHLLPLLPAAARAHDLSGFDLVVSSHHAFANRVRPAPGAVHVSYTHTPARWMWEPRMRADEIGGPVGRFALGAFAATQRGADRRAAARLDGIVANSTAVKERVRRWWHRDATVVAPPVDTEFFCVDPAIEREPFFLSAGRLVPYKRPDVAVAAARAARARLVVVGEGRARPACERLAGAGIEFAGAVDDATLRDLYRRCLALVYPGEEDFGIVMAEAQACGAPVIALDAGGARDIVGEGSGVRYSAGADPVVALADQLRGFAPDRFDPAAIAAGASRWSRSRFRAEFAGALDSVLAGRGHR